MMPKNKTHTECTKNKLDFCNGNQSTHLVSENQVGIRTKTFMKILDEYFCDAMIAVYTSKGCTSLNECCNHVMAGYVDKKRWLGARAYKGACARGIAQYNDPYIHLKNEMNLF